MPVVRSFDVSDVLPEGEAIRAHCEDGVVCLRKAFGSDWLNIVEEGTDLALSGASADLDVVKADGDKGRFCFSSQAWTKVEPFKRFIFDSRLPDLSWPFLQSETLTLFHDFLLIKEGRSDNAATPWHQDHACYPLTGRKVINCWTALDPIPAATALRFLKGSHKPGTVFQAVKFKNPDEDYRHLRRDENGKVLTSSPWGEGFVG